MLLNLKTITKCVRKGVPFAPGVRVIMFKKHKLKRGEVMTSQDEKKQASAGRSFMNEGQ